MNATRNYTLFALTLTTMLLSAACLDDTLTECRCTRGRGVV